MRPFHPTRKSLVSGKERGEKKPGDRISSTIRTRISHYGLQRPDKRRRQPRRRLSLGEFSRFLPTAQPNSLRYNKRRSPAIAVPLFVAGREQYPIRRTAWRRRVWCSRLPVQSARHREHATARLRSPGDTSQPTGEAARSLAAAIPEGPSTASGGLSCPGPGTGLSTPSPTTIQVTS